MPAAGWPGMFSGAFLVGSVAGPVVGSLTAGLGLSAPFIIYGALLLIAAAVILVEPARFAACRAGTQRRVDGHRASCAAAPGLSGGAVVQLRYRLVDVRTAFRAGAAIRRRDAGPQPRNRRPGAGRVRRRQRVAVMPSGRLSDRIGRKPLLSIGLALAGITTAVLGLASSLPVFLVMAVLAGLASGIYNSPQQAAVADIIGKARGGTGDRDVPDDVGLRLHRRIVRGGGAGPAVVLRVGVCGQRGDPGARRDRVVVRAGDP